MFPVDTCHSLIWKDQIKGSASFTVGWATQNLNRSQSHFHCREEWQPGKLGNMCCADFMIFTCNPNCKQCFKTVTTFTEGFHVNCTVIAKIRGGIHSLGVIINERYVEHLYHFLEQNQQSFTHHSLNPIKSHLLKQLHFFVCSFFRLKPQLYGWIDSSLVCQVKALHTVKDVYNLQFLNLRDAKHDDRQWQI